MTRPAPDDERERLLEKVRPYQGRLAWGALLLFVTQALEKAIPWLFRIGLDALRAADALTVRNTALGVIALSTGAWFVRTRSRMTRCSSNMFGGSMLSNVMSTLMC